MIRLARFCGHQWTTFWRKSCSKKLFVFFGEQLFFILNNFFEQLLGQLFSFQTTFFNNLLDNFFYFEQLFWTTFLSNFFGPNNFFDKISWTIFILIRAYIQYLDLENNGTHNRFAQLFWTTSWTSCPNLNNFFGQLFEEVVQTWTTFLDNFLEKLFKLEQLKSCTRSCSKKLFKKVVRVLKIETKMHIWGANQNKIAQMYAWAYIWN